jgi:hypothetical protein
MQQYNPPNMQSYNNPMQQGYNQLNMQQQGYNQPNTMQQQGYNQSYQQPNTMQQQSTYQQPNTMQQPSNYQQLNTMQQQSTYQQPNMLQNPMQVFNQQPSTVKPITSFNRYDQPASMPHLTPTTKTLQSNDEIMDVANRLNNVSLSDAEDSLEESKKSMAKYDELHPRNRKLERPVFEMNNSDDFLLRGGKITDLAKPVQSIVRNKYSKIDERIDILIDMKKSFIEQVEQNRDRFKQREEEDRRELVQALSS